MKSQQTIQHNVIIFISGIERYTEHLEGKSDIIVCVCTRIYINRHSLSTLKVNNRIASISYNPLAIALIGNVKIKNKKCLTSADERRRAHSSLRRHV